MQVRIQTNDVPMIERSRRAVDRAVRLGIGRYGATVDALNVVLSRSPGLSGDPLTRCRLRARLRNGDQIEIDSHASDPVEAARRAAVRFEARMDRSRLNQRDLAANQRSTFRQSVNET